MDMRDIFGKALGIDKPWFIADVNFDVKTKRLDIKIDFPKGTTFPFEQGGIIGEYKAYDTVENEAIHQEKNVTLFTPVKKGKGQKFLDTADQWLSTSISQVRQPIESLFNWVNERTGIQIASKVRSYQGLMVHVFGRLAAALFIMRDKMITNEH